MSADTGQRKQAARTELKARLKAAAPEYLQSIDAEIIRRFLSLPEYAVARSIFCYVAFSREVATRAIMEQALADNKLLCVPLIVGDGLMQARSINDMAGLQPGAYGILAPDAAAPEMDIRDIDLLIVPGLGFDAERWRLGRGGGYYDRFLAASTGTSVGLTRELQMLDSTPRDEWDRPVDILLTEKRIIKN